MYIKDNKQRIARWEFFGGNLKGIKEKLEYIKSNSYVDYLYDLMTKYKAERAFVWNRAEGLAKEAMKVGGLEKDVKKLKQQN